MADYSIKRFNRYSDEELIEAAKELSRSLKTEYISGNVFQRATGISPTTIENRFGSWSNFCNKVGIKPVIVFKNTSDVLFQNLNQVWEKLGRQPRAKEMKKPLSTISYARYQRKYGDWYKACVEFLAWKSGVSAKKIEEQAKPPLVQIVEQKTPRAISLSLRYEVLKRDSFKCVRCGRTPASNPGIELHVDHKKPFSKGGAAEITNLQTMCSECNLGKSNRHAD